MAQNQTKTIDDEAAVLEKVAALPGEYRVMGEKLHELITKEIGLKPRLWYGMPGYAKSKSGPVLCFFRKDKYMTFGLNEQAEFDFSGGIAPSGWFFIDLTKEVEDKIRDILKKSIK